jgi:hypothetical protein
MALRVFLLITIFILLYFNYVYTPKKKDEEEIYNIHNFFENLFNLIMILTFSIICVFGIFFLRIKNSSNYVDLKVLYLKLSLYTASWMENILNITLIIFSCIFYLVIITKLMRYLKKHLIKRHIKLSNNTLYLSLIKNIDKISIYKFIYMFSSKAFKLFMEYPLKKKYPEVDIFKINWEKGLAKYCYTFYKFIIRLVNFIALNMHYIILFLVIIYDMLYNNFIILNLFKVLPYIFIYELYLRISKFVEYKSLRYDVWLYEFFYGAVELISEQEIILGEDYVLMEEFKLAIEYLKNGLYDDPLKK